MLIKLTAADNKRCAAFGHRAAEAYAAGKKEQSKALAVPGKPAIHGDWKAHANARLAELAFVRAIGVADGSLDWSDGCDASYDIRLHNLKIDVKSSSHPRASRLIWPVSKNHFIGKAADILVFAKVKLLRNDPAAAAEISLAGWIGLHTFLAKAKTADGERGLTDGTRYMHESELNAMPDLFHITAIAAAVQTIGNNASYA